MKSKLYDADYNLICDSIESAIDYLDTIKIKNRLLNGQYHTQTIGSPVKMFNITLNADETIRKAINDFESASAEIILVRDNRYYQGSIISTPQWTPKVKGEYLRRTYTGQITIAINEEGDA